MLQALTDEITVSPGFHVVTVLPESNAVGAPGGAAEGQIFFELGTRYIDRAGGGFFGGAVVGGYHATHPSGGVSGFAAFCLASAQSTTIRTLSAPEYGTTGAHDLRLQMFDYQRNLLWVRP
jgi:hypothetical protein